MVMTDTYASSSFSSADAQDNQVHMELMTKHECVLRFGAQGGAGPTRISVSYYICLEHWWRRAYL